MEARLKISVTRMVDHMEQLVDMIVRSWHGDSHSVASACVLRTRSVVVVFGLFCLFLFGRHDYILS